MNKHKLRRIIKKLDEKPKGDPLSAALRARPSGVVEVSWSNPVIDRITVTQRERCPCCGQWRLRAL